MTIQRISLQVVLACVFYLYAEASLECTPFQFKCTNQKCVPSRWICDGGDDCKDNSDEKECVPFHCHPLTLQCLSGKCIPHSRVCDSGNNCGDNSDEQFCDPFHCHPSSFQCLNGKCISRASFCTIRQECEDNSDELYCDKRNNDACPPGWFECADKRRCIPSQWVCDGFPDCTDVSEERNCGFTPCTPSTFRCLNGSCISRDSFCNGRNDCGDNSDEQYCNKTTNDICPPDWFQCPKMNRCIPSQWGCDGYVDCMIESEEKNCDNYIAKTKLRSWFLKKRKSSSVRDRWGSQIHRIAVALHLDDNSTFGSGNSTGEELRSELTTQLLYRLPRNKMSSQELALYIHALLVACLDPRDFYGSDLVRDLRRRVEVAGSYTNPFLILVLCNAGDTMMAKDVERVTAAYDSQHRPFWTDSQALSSMALSCIASHSSGLVDERTLMDMLQELKKRQFRNGTVDNFRTTALVTQALFIYDSYLKDFDLDSAIKILVDGLNGSTSLLNAYYALPVLHRKSLLNVSSSHCNKQPVEEEEALQKVLDVKGETITVQYSVWMGDEINVGRTWRLRMLVNSTIYDAIETVANIDNRQKVEYNVVDGKPYVASLNGKEDDPEIGMFWFIYLKALNSDEQPKIVEQSPVDAKLMPQQELILWYKRGTWDSQTLNQKLVTSS